MNSAQALTYEPSGIGLIWMVDQLPAWLNPQKRKGPTRQPDFLKAINERILPIPRSLHQLYESMPAQFRTVQDYRNLESQLRRLVRSDKISRIGSAGDYRYLQTVPKL